MTRLLVLDDEFEICQLIGDLAAGFGFEIELTNTPADFRERFTAHLPDLIVLDLVFPGGDGIEMVRYLEASRYKGALIIVSGMDDRVLTTAQRLGIALGLNVIGSVRKPFAPKTVRDLFAKIAESRGNYSPGELRTALDNQEMVLHYQPVVDMKSRRILGVEALVRWAHPTRGLVMPDNFLPSIAREGLMSDLTWRVLGMALDAAAGWRSAGTDLRIAVNFPASILRDDMFLGRLAIERERFAQAPPRLMVELTETEAMDEPLRMMEVLSRLRLTGIELAIDDFGTGYSSLVELRRLPVNHLKIDKSFVLSCVKEADAAAITRAVIELSHALGVKVVAEGIETQEIWNQLAEWGCDAAQGYYISRPMPGDDLLSWVGGWDSPSLTRDKTPR